MLAILNEKILFRNHFIDNVVVYIMNNKNGRILGIDYGSKRIGLAISDERCQFALPLSVIINDKDLIVKIEKIIIDNDVKAIVIGESRNFAGEPNNIFFDSVELKEKLESKGYQVYFEPEFLTSVQAGRFQGKTDLLDSSAAAIILQSYLDRENKDD